MNAGEHNLEAVVSNLEDSSIEKFDTDLLIRLSPLTKGPLRERRDEIKKNVILAVLSKYDVGGNFDVEEIKISIKSISKCSFTNERIISILDNLVEGSYIQHVGGLNYILRKKMELPKFQDITQSAWNEFIEFVKNNYDDYDPYLDVSLRNVFDAVLLKILAKFAISNIYTTKKVETLPIEGFKLIISSLVEKYQISKKYADLIDDFLKSDSPHFLELIFDTYNSFINVDIILREQEIPSIDFTKNIKFVLVDTTIITSLLCESHPMYPMVHAVTKQCQQNNIPLHYCDKTERELWGLVKGSKHEMSHLAESTEHGIIRSPFVKDFINKEISWHDYLTLLYKWEKILDKEWNIKPIPNSIKIDIDKDVYRYFENTLPILDNLRGQERSRSNPFYQYELRNEHQIEHDAYCVALISHMRKLENEKKQDIKIGPWFLTYDSLVSAADAAYFSNNLDFGMVIQLRTLLNYLLIYSKIKFDKKEMEQVAEAIIKYTTSIEGSIVSLDDYTRLVSYKIGLEESYSAIIKDIFLASPLRAELEIALKLNRGGRADNTAYLIFSDKKFIETIVEERRSEDKFKHVLDAFKKVKAELEKEIAIRQSLEKIKGPNIRLTIDTNIDVSIQTQVFSLINLLEAQNIFQKGLLEKPSEITNKEKLIDWLKKAKKLLETSKEIGETAKVALLPLAKFILDSLSSGG